MMGWYGYGWAPYVPVAKRRAKAKKKIEKLRKKGMDIQPVDIEGRKIARTFWGEAWCDHLEKFSDFENRLPRGRTYVRNGSVCHLEIKKGEIKAMVSGSRLYNVNVAIKKLPKKKWTDVKGRCAGQIGSLLELLQGKLSKSVMSVVTDRNKGLFPLPKEISLKCSCPDWAVMCKHVAATLYGVGARLDEKPDLLFLLRGVDHEELISAEVGVAAATAGKKGGRRRIAASDVADVFGIDMAEEEKPSAGKYRKRRKKKATVKTKRSRTGKTKQPAKKTGKPGKVSAKQKTKAAVKPTRKKAVRKTKKTAPMKTAQKVTRGRSLTGAGVARLRAKFDMTQAEFARLLGVSAATISNWEKTAGRLNMQARMQEAWNEVRRLTKQKARNRLDA